MTLVTTGAQVKNFNASISQFQRFLPLDLKAGSDVLVNVSFSTPVTPEKFYCYRKNDFFANVVCDMAEMYVTELPHLPTLETFAQGMPCLAKNPDDMKKRYQRCEIINILDDSCHVLFVDYPLEIIVDKKELYAAPEKIISGWRKQAFCCELSGIVPSCESLETREVREKVFRNWIQQQGTPLNCKIKECKSLENEDMVFVVELVSLKVFNFEELNKIALAIDQQATVNSKKVKIPIRYKKPILEEDELYDCCVTSVLNPNRFFVKPLAANKLIADLTKGLHNLYDFSECSKLQFVDNSVFKKDLPAVAKINLMWYRCVIKSVIDHDSIHIALVDHENEEVDINKSSLRYITKEFHKIPQQIVECCCFGIPTKSDWTTSEINTFNDLLSSNENLVKILVRRRSVLTGIHEVEIFVDDFSVIEKFQEDQRKKAEAAARESECIICMDSNKDTTLFPCGHSSFCYSDAQTLFKNKQCCPVCRCEIKSISLQVNA